MSHPRFVLLLAALMSLAACVSDPYTKSNDVAGKYRQYERYEPSLTQLARMAANPPSHQDQPFITPVFSDALVIDYSDHVKSILRAKFTTARFARYTSGTVQVVLAGLAGAGAALSFGTTAVAALGLGSALTPQLSSVFNAKAQAEIYQDAVRYIEEAEVDYLKNNPEPSAEELTPNGILLYQRVTGTVHIVEKSLAGHLPSLQDLQQATEAMSSSGATTSPRKKHRRQSSVDEQSAAKDKSSAAKSSPTPADSITILREKISQKVRAANQPDQLLEFCNDWNLKLLAELPTDEAAKLTILKGSAIVALDDIKDPETLRKIKASADQLLKN